MVNNMCNDVCNVCVFFYIHVVCMLLDTWISLGINDPLLYSTLNCWGGQRATVPKKHLGCLCLQLLIVQRALGCNLQSCNPNLSRYDQLESLHGPRASKWARWILHCMFTVRTEVTRAQAPHGSGTTPANCHQPSNNTRAWASIAFPPHRIPSAWSQVLGVTEEFPG